MGAKLMNNTESFPIILKLVPIITYFALFKKHRNDR